MGKHLTQRQASHGRKGVLALAVAIMLAITTVAWADSLDVNTVNLGGTQGLEVAQGESISVPVRIVGQGGDGGPSGSGGNCNASAGNPIVVGLTGLPSGVTAGTTSFTDCGVFQNISLTASATATVGDASVTTTNTGGNGTTNNESFTLRVLAAADSTPPVITPNVSGTLGDNGWYTNNVVVTWTVSDAQSAISSSSGCGLTPINADTTGTTLTCAATSGGGTNSVSVTIKRDATLPDINDDGPSSVPDGLNGWYVSEVTNLFSATDATSGLADPTQASFSKSSGTDEGSNVTIDSGSVDDMAGNSNLGITAGPFMVDLSDPTVTCHAAPTFLLNQSGASVSATVTDAISGAASPTASASADTSDVGAMTVDITGYDVAGRSTTASCSYNVVYDFAGFFQPVDNLPTWNKAKAGSAIPVKFTLDGNQGLGILKVGYPKAISVACPASAGGGDLVEVYADAANQGLVYDADAGQYVYVWKTAKTWAGKCFSFELGLRDGSTHTFLVNFTK